MGGGEHSAFALYMDFPAFADHLPVGIVTVHGDDHTAAAGGDLEVASQCFQIFFKGINVFQSGGFRHIASVQKNMDPDGSHPFFFCLFQHPFQVGNIAVNVSVREQSQEVKSAAGLGFGDHIFPGLPFKHLACRDGFGNQFGSLGKDSAAAHGIVTDFTVAHIFIAGQSHGSTVCFEERGGVLFHQLMKEGGGAVQHGIPVRIFPDSDSVHDKQHNRAASLGELFIDCKFIIHKNTSFWFGFPGK